MSLFPSVPATIYAAGTQVKSADLNDFEEFMLATKTHLEGGGPVVHRLYEPDVAVAQGASAGNLLSSRLTLTTGAFTAGGVIAAPSGLNHPLHYLRVLDAATTEAVILERLLKHRDPDDLCIAFELDLRADAVGANGVDIQMILGNNDVSPHVGIVKRSTDTNWFMSVDGGSPTRTDTATVPVVNVFQTFRVEYFGANTPVGVANSTAPVARFYVDDALEGEISDANVPTSSDFSGGMGFRVTNFGDGTGPVGDHEVQVGPVRYAYAEI